MSNHPSLGQLIAPDANAVRDCIHIALVPLVAGVTAHLDPGEPFALDSSGRAIPAGSTKEPIGVVDPFLQTSVRPSERFYGVLNPGSVTNLRHSFDHHAFPADEAEVKVVERIVAAPEDPEVAAVREYAKSHGLTLQEVMDTASETLQDSCRGCH